MDILQKHLPFTPWSDPALARLPGMRPVEGDWLIVDEAYAAQMAHKARLIKARRSQVLALDPAAEPAAREALEVVLGALPAGFERQGDAVRCPDGRVVVPKCDAPLESLGGLIQEDVVLLQKREGAFVLTGALLCFPAAWTLAEKFMQPLEAIHRPVSSYAPVAARVERMFERVRVGQPLWRANALMYHDAELYQPHSETAPRIPPKGTPRYLRAERQTILRLPRTDALVFLVHTYVLPFDRLTSEQQASCPFHQA